VKGFTLLAAISARPAHELAQVEDIEQYWYTRFSNASISFIRSEHLERITLACKSIWSRSSLVKCLTLAQDDWSEPPISIVREGSREGNAFRASRFK
jgi:hypothetical protein